MIASLYSMTDPVVFLCRCTHACVSLERAVATTSTHVIPWALWTLPIWLQNTTQHWDSSYPHPPGPLCSPHTILPSCVINHHLLTGTCSLAFSQTSPTEHSLPLSPWETSAPPLLQLTTVCPKVLSLLTNPSMPWHLSISDLLQLHSLGCYGPKPRVCSLSLTQTSMSLGQSLQCSAPHLWELSSIWDL